MKTILDQYKTQKYIDDFVSWNEIHITEGGALKYGR